MADCSFVLVRFECSFAAAAPSTIIHLVGDHPALGCWNPAQSIALQRRGDLWVTESPVSLPYGSFEYKYILLANGQVERWEMFEGNRCLAAFGETLTMCDRFDHNASQPSGTELVHVSSSTVSLSQAGDACSAPSALLEGPAVLVVSYILPLLISRDGDNWRISWNEDAITAKV